MLRFTCYVKRFAMCTMYRVFERLKRPPLGAVAPPDSEAKAGKQGSGVNQSHYYYYYIPDCKPQLGELDAKNPKAPAGKTAQ